MPTSLSYLRGEATPKINRKDEKRMHDLDTLFGKDNRFKERLNSKR